jgi:hypothetical protein
VGGSPSHFGCSDEAAAGTDPRGSSGASRGVFPRQARSLASAACLAGCTLDGCLDEGCWLDRVRIPAAVEALLQRFLEQATPHLIACADAACRHFAHEVARAGSGDRAA